MLKQDDYDLPKPSLIPGTISPNPTYVPPETNGKPTDAGEMLPAHVKKRVEKRVEKRK